MGYFYYPISIGYIPRWIGTTVQPNLSEVIHLDDARWSFLQSDMEPQAGNYTYTEFGSAMVATYGDGANLVTPYPTGNFSETLLDTWRLWIPAVGLGFENTIQARRDGLLNTNESTVVIICSKLHRVLICNGLSNPENTFVWEYNNGTIGERLTGGSANWRFLAAVMSRGDETNGWLFITSRGNTPSDFLDVNNWGNIYQINPNVRSADTTRPLQQFSKTVNADYLIRLFGDAEAPDEPDTPSSDPYQPGGESGAGGGTGTFDGTSDDIDIPDLPTLSAADTGFITLFNPSLSQLKSLADYMWSDLFSLETFKKMFADPMQAILGLSIVPVAVPNGGSREVIVGNVPTGLTMNIAASQYVEVDCGTLDVKEYWGAYLDYDPFTKCHIYLPYIGTHPIATDDVMGKLVHIVYHVDILSGACTAFVKCGNSVIYQFIGQVSSSIPVTGSDFTNVINGALNIASAIGTMIGTGGLSAPLSAPVSEVIGAMGGLSGIANNMVQSAPSVAQDVMSMKPQVEKSGSLSGTGGMLSVQVPYMILERPNQAVPANQNSFMGYPSYMTRKLGSLSGYTEVEHIHLENVPCTELEAVEILKYLEGGVIL